VDDASSEEVILSATSESVEASTISYPAPLPRFSAPIVHVLKDGNKTKVMLLYSDIIKEACAFYSAICPSQTGLAKQSLLNVGKTVTENFPCSQWQTTRTRGHISMTSCRQLYAIHVAV